jgi:hypothetical protein
MSTYAQSHNRRMNTKRHIESSVRRLFSGDSCILVPRVNFTKKAPPIIKTLTNFRLRHIFSQPCSPSHSLIHTPPTRTSTIPSQHQSPTSINHDTAISPPAMNIITSAHLHPFTNVPAHRPMCSICPDCHC